jgi:hypothetical protein
VPLPNIAFSLTGAKTIGTTDASAPIYKTNVSATTDASGSAAQSLEWDSYALTLAGHDVVDACNAPPYNLSPGASLASALYLGPNTSNSLLVAVRDNAGAAVPGATVTVVSGGTTRTGTTSACGASYFGALTAGSTYTITVSKTGYTTVAGTNVTVSGDTFYATAFE